MYLLSVRANPVKTQTNLSCLIVESKCNIHVFICLNPHKCVTPHPRAPHTPILCLTHVPTDLLYAEVLLPGLRFQK